MNRDRTAHLRPEYMEPAQRQLLAKAIAEFSHEKMLTPQPLGEDRWELRHPAGVRYSFTARVHPMEHWVIDSDSLVVEGPDGALPVDAVEFCRLYAGELGIPASLLPVYLEEMSATLAGAAWKRRHRTETVAELLEVDHVTLEGSMTEGHPAFVATNGRIGFGVEDHHAYAPEAQADVRLLWLAARRDHAVLHLGEGLSEQAHWEHELGDQACAFRGQLVEQGLDPADYQFLPVHPHQWDRRIAITFAPDVARRDLVLLGPGRDRHRACQSIRTFSNVSDPRRSFTKTALAIQNMGFLRGLSPAYMEATPAINDFVYALVQADETLARCGFTVLRERAAIGWTGDTYHRMEGSSAYKKMIAALWRESPADRIGPGERLVTMASLLHRDQAGDSLAGAMIAASGRSASAWVRAYLEAYVRPLVHCMLAYDLAFMPHGENLILVLRDQFPVGAVMKDIGEEVVVMGDLPLPEGVERIRAEMSQDVKSLGLFTDVFDGFLRFFGALLAEDGLLSDEEFWRLVAECLDAHAADHPELAEAVARYDFTRAEFVQSCLNRLQLKNTLEMVDLADQASSLQFAGTLANPVAREG